MPKWIVAARVDEISPGEVKYVEASGFRLALCNVDGEYYAIADECTHDGGPLGQGRLEGCQIECPRHGARFDVRTGRAVRLPAVVPVQTYPVKIEGGKVKIGLE